MNQPNASTSPSDKNEQLSLRPSGPRYGKKRWTLGLSASLVEGGPREPLWVSVAWIVVPTGLFMLLLAAMVGA